MDTNNLTCMELVELVTDYLEGALAASDQIRFEQHLAGCEACSTYLQQIRHTIQLTGRLTEEKLEPTSKQVLLDLFRDWKSGEA